MRYDWLRLAITMQSIAQAGLAYAQDPYDLDRYRQLRELSLEVLADFTGTDLDRLAGLFAKETGYQTPKIDVRAVVMDGDRILLVQEKTDLGWSLPGGWAEVGLTATENTVKEVHEESGLDVRPLRLLALLDRSRHSHPPSPWSIYRIFLLCEPTGGELQPSLETLDAGFFSLDQLPPLSAERINMELLARLAELAKKPDSPVWLD